MRHRAAPWLSVASETNTEGGQDMQATSSLTSSHLGSGSRAAAAPAVALRQMLRCPSQGLKRSSSSTAAACAPSGSSAQKPYTFCERTHQAGHTMRQGPCVLVCLDSSAHLPGHDAPRHSI